MNWYVVDTELGIRYEPGYLTEAEAIAASVQKTLDDDEDVPDRYQVEQHSPDGPWAYAIPTQTGR